jgi:DNA-binding beta-propeller fold protein YncE
MPRLTSIYLALALGLSGLATPARALPRVDRVPSSLVYPDFWHTPFGIHRGTEQLLDLMLAGQVHFDDPAGLACVHMLESGDAGPPLTVFGLNRGAGQIVYNPDMRSLAVFGEEGLGEGRFFRPQGIACLRDGTVAVADTGNDRVVFLRFTHGALRWDHVLGMRGTGPGEFMQPGGVALDSQGRLFVADTGNNRIQAFDRQGRFLESFGGDPEANNAVQAPQALSVVDSLEPDAPHPDSAVFVIDEQGARLQKFSLAGEFLGQAVASDLGRSAVRFNSLALDYFNNVWVTDRLSDQIHKFDQHLQWVADWGHPGQGDGALDDPRGIGINRPYGQVVVLERNSAQYLWIGADIEDVRFSHQADLAQGGRLRVDYRLSERAWVDAWVENGEQQRIATLLTRRFQRQGAQTLNWNGALSGGGKAGTGTYFLVFQAEAAYSSSTYVKRALKLRFEVPKAVVEAAPPFVWPPMDSAPEPTPFPAAPAWPAAPFAP